MHIILWYYLNFLSLQLTLFFDNIVLENKSSTLFGKEAALFLPSGIMGNLVASNLYLYFISIT